MSTVVDASVLIAALVDSSPTGEWAEEVLAGGGLHAPELARVEATNTLRAKEIRTLTVSGTERGAGYAISRAHCAVSVYC